MAWFNGWKEGMICTRGGYSVYEITMADREKEKAFAFEIGNESRTVELRFDEMASPKIEVILLAKILSELKKIRGEG